MQIHIKNFCWWHEKYINPNYVLEYDNITLMGLTPTRAYFCVSDPNVDVTNSKLYPFIFLAHKLVTKKLIIMPLKHFHHLATDLGDPHVSVFCIHMTTRCGSTLMCQTFNEVPKVQVLSEPYVTMDIQEHYINNRWSQAETNACIKSSVRLLLKPVHNKRIEFICWKMTPITNHIPTVMHYFPQFKWIFNTRFSCARVGGLGVIVPGGKDQYIRGSEQGLQGLVGLQWLTSSPTTLFYCPLHIYIFIRTIEETIKSRIKMLNSQPLFYKLTGKYFSTSYWTHMCVNRNDHVLKGLIADYRQSGIYFNCSYTIAEKMALGIFSSYGSYLENQDKYDVFVLYEDLLENPKEVMKKVFKAVGLDLKYLDKGLTAFKRDSQHGILGAKGENRANISDKEKATMDQVAEKLGLPFRSSMTVEEMRKTLQIPE